jgi:hypothetical protein
MTDLTGIWQSEIIDFTASQKHTSESRITQTGAYIWANSATTWGKLAGYVQVIDGEEWLNALFLNEGVRYLIRAQVRSNGTVLMGAWQMAESPDRNGPYLAKRKTIPNDG